ncbi:DUF5694 domain-containing protein [Paraliobacillus ryukyuensis]|uniref:DUF5694 domain-containing protein n=1 Tax=Paraliobacillus ryukyuensis TaxID=200904 RepID=UPI0009A82BED|nr:DUF5694 domain-containing protein [Paraliobacillus ryukyuensis]
MENKPKVMILGTFHMRSTPDLHRASLDNLLSPERQQEIQEVVDGIKQFKPTKIALEVTKDQDHTLNEAYQSYRNGQLDLEVDETHQFGFQAAVALNHTKVYAVDWMENVGNKGIGEVVEWAKTEQPDLFQWLDQTYISPLHLELNEGSVKTLIRKLNDVSFIKKNHEMYMHLARIGKGTNYVGIDWVRWWYQRNLIMYANLTKITGTTDRTVLVVGSAHVYLIRQFLQKSGLFDVVSTSDYII